MAKLPAIIDLIVKHDTKSVATISNYARVLRDAGILPKGKRGRGAPDLHPTEIADLVMGVAGAGDAVDAPHAVEMLRGAKLLPKIELEHEGIVDADHELRHWSIADCCEDFGMLLASLLSDEPRRDDVQEYPNGDWFCITNMTVTINEVVPRRDFGCAEVFLDDGNQWVKLTFMTPRTPDLSNQEDDDQEPIGLGASWSRSTHIDYSFFVDASVCINGGYRNQIEQ
ncbi:hypothetical protein QCN27_13275 [Cereibacter sp. SYSU M97828]|nr:hypothetical protein [Cereibacter flavus]